MPNSTPDTPHFTLLGRLTPARLERAYLEDAWPGERSRVAFVCLITGIAYLCGIYIDYLQLGTQTAFQAMLAVRLMVSLFGLSVFFLAMPSEQNRSMANIAFTLYMLSVMFGESFELVVKGQMAVTSGLSPTVVIALFYFLFLPPSPWPPIIGAVCGGGLYLATMATKTPAPMNVVVVNFLFFILVISFGIYFLSRYGKSRRREFMAYREIKALTEIDELTGICNRRKILAIAAQKLSYARRKQQPLCFLMIDLDSFKSVNDTYGHLAGDQALKEFAKRTHALLGPEHSFGRIGGEEFLIVLPGMGMAEAGGLCAAIMQDLNATPVQYGKHAIDVTASIGMAQCHPGIKTLDELIGMADRALYEAKRQGKNRMCGLE